MDELPSEPGIYQIRCTITGDSYIGSTQNLAARFAQHSALLHRREHSNQALQKAWDDHGAQHFTFLILETLSIRPLLNAREDYWRAHHDPTCNPPPPSYGTRKTTERYKQTSICLPEDLWWAFRRYAAARGRHLQDLFEEILSAHLEEHRAEVPPPAAPSD